MSILFFIWNEFCSCCRTTNNPKIEKKYVPVCDQSRCLIFWPIKNGRVVESIVQWHRRRGILSHLQRLWWSEKCSANFGRVVSHGKFSFFRSCILEREFNSEGLSLSLRNGVLKEWTLRVFTDEFSQHDLVICSQFAISLVNICQFW